MKRCSKCNRTYDDSQSFCLMDGTPLLVESEEKMTMQFPAPRKSRFLLWLALTGSVILAGAAVAAGLLIYQFGRQDDNKRVKLQSNTSVPSLPKPPSAPTVKPTLGTNAAVNEATPQIEKLKTTPDNEDADDITPIAWETTASGFKSDENLVYKFQCPAQGTPHAIWGSDIYTQDSSICTAAVHAGLFSLASGGIVTVEFRPKRLTYGSTVRNGITSNTFGEYPHSFVVR